MPQTPTWEESEPIVPTWDESTPFERAPLITPTPYQAADIASMSAGLGKAPTGMEAGTEFLEATGGVPSLAIPSELAGRAVKAAVPLTVPGLLGRLTGQKVEAPEIKLPRAKGEGFLSGAANVALGATEAFIQPESLALLPIFGSGGGWGKLAATLFGAQQAAALPGEVQNAIKVLDDPNSTQAQKVEAIGLPAVNAAVSGLMMRQGARTPAEDLARVLRRAKPPELPPTVGFEEGPAIISPESRMAERPPGMVTAGDYLRAPEVPVMQQLRPGEELAGPTTSELSPAAEAAIQSIRPAVKLVPEAPGAKPEIVVGDKGETHPDIIKKEELKAEDIDKREFVGPQGEELSREQVAALGVPTGFEPGKAHSVDLAKAQEATQPSPAAVPDLKPTTPAPSPPSASAKVEGEVRPADLLNKSQLIEQLIGKKPEARAESIGSRVQWEKDRKAYAKRTVAELRDMLTKKQAGDAAWKARQEEAKRIVPEIQKIADDAKSSWRTALKAKADQEGVRFSPLTTATKGDAVYALSSAIAEKNLKPPTPPPAEPGMAGPGMVGMGGALAGEVAEGAGADIYGIAQRVREARQKAGYTSEAAATPGKGISAKESIERGRELLDQGKDPNEVLGRFEQTKQISSEDMAVVRAEGERLAREARRIEEKFGTESQQYIDAWNRVAKWDERSKAMQTEWHKTGMAQQGETDIDTGTFTGLQRAHREVSERDFTPKQTKKAKDIASKNAAAQKAEAEARAKLKAEIAGTPLEAVAPEVKSLADRIIASLDKTGQDALARIKARRAEGRLFTGIPVEDLYDYSVYGASVLGKLGVKGAVKLAEWKDEMRKAIGDYIVPHLDQIYALAERELDRQIDRVSGPEKSGEVRRSIVRQSQPGSIRAANRRALDAAWRTVRNWAAKVAELEVKRGIAEAVRTQEARRIAEAQAKKGEGLSVEQRKAEAIKAARVEAAKPAAEAKRARETRDIGIEQAKKGLDIATKRARDMAAKAAAEERKDVADPSRAVWRAASRYLDQGLDNFDDIRSKIATELGMSTKQVTKLLLNNKRMKYLADDLWSKQQRARRLKQQAKRWLNSLDTPLYEKALARIPSTMFRIKVGFHGTVALGTHAPQVLFQPQYWASYVRNFGIMYKMAFSKTYYERQIQELIRRNPEKGGHYVTARRAGLVNDPYIYEDFTAPDMAKYFGNLAGMGNRGYTILKILRQDMFDQHWNNLPKSMQIPEVAQAIADGINHATGVVKTLGGGELSRHAHLALFAPKLEAARVMWLLGDPVRAARTFANWKDASIGDRHFAMNQVKEKGITIATFLGLLSLNQGVLMAMNSDQKINFTNPLQGDWLKFKVANHQVSYGNPIITMMRLPLRMGVTAYAGTGKLSKIVYADEKAAGKLWEYIRTQLSPFAGTFTDLLFGADYMQRPLPSSFFGLGKQPPMPKRLKAEHMNPYTWPEYWAETLSMIPVSEGLKEVWKEMGMTDEQMSLAKKTGITVAVLARVLTMAGTGARINPDWTLEQAPQ